jgi:hypothetical protein
VQPENSIQQTVCKTNMQVGSIPNNNAQKESSISGEIPIAVQQKLKKAVLIGLGHFAPSSTVEILINVLEQEHSIDFATIPNNPMSLREGLSKMFGSAEPVIESRIRQAIAKELGVSAEGRSLEDLVTLCKQSDAQFS